MLNINGIQIKEPLPDIMNGLNGEYPDMLILGGGTCVWEDYFAARKLLPKAYIMCINDIGAQFKVETIQHIVSLHPKLLNAVRAFRIEKSMIESVASHSNVKADGVNCVWNIANNGGTSGFFALKICLVLGCKKIILCGIPMDGGGHYFDPPDASLNSTTRFDSKATFYPWWQEMLSSPVALERVRSMSGKTAELFGKPTKEWVQS